MLRRITPSFIRQGRVPIRSLPITRALSAPAYSSSSLLARAHPPARIQASIVRSNPSQYSTISEERPTKSASSSRVTTTHVIVPEQLDRRGYVHGGDVLGWMDLSAACASGQFSGVACVTASVDAVHLIQPLRLGDLAILTSQVTRSWRSSMEVSIRVEAEHMLTGRRTLCSHAFITMVAMKEGRPTTVPELIPEGPEEVMMHAEADLRRSERFREREHRSKSKDSPKVIRDLRSYSDSLSATHTPTTSTSSLQLSRSPSTRTCGFLPAELTPADSFTESAETVLPAHTNMFGATFGGQMMKWMTQCALISAIRHCRKDLLLVSTDRLNFHSSTQVGDMITLRSVVSRSWGSSVEVYVTSESEGIGKGGSNTWSNDAFVTFVAVDDLDRPLSVPSLIPASAEEERMWEGGEARRALRLSQRAHVSADRG
ncbi:HotDog domain-containing protein [Piptocephalis cylindrospora]|uniref:HotDog domain-containing protein n=1 Tax=Piptocephalis cylindrospora TaxID=1907219 RepID=A0A4P9Y6I2_9FUNG|nr:HotDog domain-containing protein [Piptocephalis cylindrospora]|eukprot:RKP14392.1 HotDog domain-containing protein [Piptocephalis cylindrospora]